MLAPYSDALIFTEILSLVCVTIDGVWIGNWIYGTQLVTTSNYNAITNSHTL
jgi:hypothetical protein